MSKKAQIQQIMKWMDQAENLLAKAASNRQRYTAVFQLTETVDGELDGGSRIVFIIHPPKGK